MICLRIGKTYTTKTPPGDFKVTIPENSLLSQKAVTSKRISVPYTNQQLNFYPNTQLDLFCSNNLSFSMHGSQYVTNQFVRIPVRDLITNLKRMLAAKFFISSRRWRSWSCLVTKPYGVQTQQLLQELGQTRFSVTLLHTCEICSCATCITFDDPNIILTCV